MGRQGPDGAAASPMYQCWWWEAGLGSSSRSLGAGGGPTRAGPTASLDLSIRLWLGELKTGFTCFSRLILSLDSPIILLVFLASNFNDRKSACCGVVPDFGSHAELCPIQ